MNKVAYREALRYAYRLNQTHYKDIVHDAYLAYYKSKGINLFDQHRGVITKTVKNVYWNGFIIMKQFMWRGVKYPKVYWPLVEDFQHEPKNRGETCIVAKTTETPGDIMIFEDLLATIRGKLKPKQEEVYTKLLAGYSSAEIAEQVNTSRQLINHRVNKIRQVIKETLE